MAANRLTALDSSFLHLEDASSHMHVAAALLLEGPPPTQRQLLDHIESRLHLVPRFRQKLRFVPLGQGRPVWVDDPHFNLEYHVRVAALPPPGNEEQLKRLAGRVFSQQLDRTKPLWEMWLVQGLDRGGDDEGAQPPDRGRRFALLSKTHHCLVDGISGVDITAVLFDTAPEAESIQPPGPVREMVPEPTPVQLLGEALVERATRPAELVRSARAAFRAPRHVARRAVEALGGIGALARAGLSPAPESSLNVDIGPHRRFEWVRVDLDLVKEVKNGLGGTVNDVVLAVVTGALRRFLEERGERTADVELKALVPTSVRHAGERGLPGNRVAAVMAPLPVSVADPVQRLHIVRDAMAGLKEGRQAVGAQALTELSGFAPPTVLAQAARLQARQRFFNLVVTNVPGPQVDLYMLGRRLADVFPLAPLARRQALTVAVMSYRGRLGFGLLGDFDAMADLSTLGRALRESVDELRTAAGIPRTKLGAARSSPRSTGATEPARPDGRHAGLTPTSRRGQ